MIIEELNDGKYKLSISPKGVLKDYVLQEHKDKYLYDVNKTIGFRKDKKLNKFVGLRDGVSKQLEFTLISVLLDDVNKIPKNRINFNSVSLENDVVIHNIGDISFYNTINNTNYKNMLKITSPFKSLEILYEIHTKGIRVSNRMVGDTYYSNNKDQYILIDEGNMETIFIIDKPNAIDDNGNKHNIVSHKLFKQDGKLYYKKTIGVTSNIYKFPLLIDANIIINEDVDLYFGGVGVISSSGTSWTDVINGTSDLSIIYSSSVGTWVDAVTNSLSGGTYQLNRTFLNFNTSHFSSYTESLSSVRLLLTNYNFNNESVFIMMGTQGNTLETSDWNNYSNYITGGTFVDINQTLELNIPISSLNLSGLTSFVVLSSEIEPTSDIISNTGIDFGNTTLEVIYEPIKVYGQTQLNVQKGNYFSLTGYTNSGSSNNIEWYKDSGYTELISIGSSMSGYSMDYQINNIIYAVIPISFDTFYSQPLIVTINVIQLDYTTLPIKLIDYDEIDIDSIYFKFHKCFSGICYSYVRDINNAYEGNPLVSDSWGNESYNLYNEFDIIDEFFSNSHEVEVAYNSNLDLTKRYNDLDGVFLREGTRVLLMAQTNLNELGVYVTQYDNTLIRTDEMNTYEDLFRYKAHIGAGTYTDQEVHVWPILPPPDAPYITFSQNPIDFNYESGLTQQVIILSNVDWCLYNTIPWLTVDLSCGNNGTTTITIITTMVNNTSYKRFGTIEFISELNNVTAILTISQESNILLVYRITTDGNSRVNTDGDIRILT